MAASSKLTAGKKAGRATPAETTTAKEGPARARGSGVQIVYETLRRTILELELEPGSPLDEVSLSEQFAMSRTPIREALVRLSTEGLVTTLPNRSTIVSAIDLVRLPIYFEALTLMYRVTTRGAAANRRDVDLVTIRKLQMDYAEAVNAHDVPGMIQTNRDFHVAIAVAAGNTYFTALFSRLLDEGRRILRLYYKTFDDVLPRRFVDEHEAMVVAIDARNTELADRLGAQHAAQIVAQIQSYISRDPTTDIDLTP